MAIFMLAHRLETTSLCPLWFAFYTLSAKTPQKKTQSMEQGNRFKYLGEEHKSQVDSDKKKIKKESDSKDRMLWP